MELKDVILSTLAEMEDDVPFVPQNNSEDFQVQEHISANAEPVERVEEKTVEPAVEASSIETELIYLNSIRERLLVLFEGFQAPNNANIEAKVDMTLNFLEYTLATIDSRVQILEKGNLK